MSRRNDKDLARDVFEHRRDVGEWSDEHEHIEVRPSRSSVISFRLPVREFEELQQATKESGETVADFIRAAIKLRVLHSGPQPSIQTFSGGAHVQVTASVPLESAWSDAPRSQDQNIQAGEVNRAPAASSRRSTAIR